MINCIPLKQLGKFLIIFWFSTIVVSGQTDYQLEGYIVDEESGEPVSFASVGVPQQQRGISANMNGYFKLVLPDKNQSHQLVISSIGYQRRTVLFSEIDWDQQQTFELVPAPTVLDEIVIIGKSQTLKDLVKSASKNRKEYLRSAPYLMNGFYRETMKLEGRYEGFTEAQGILYMNGYNSNYKNNSQHLTYDLAQWKNIRRSNYPKEEQKYLEIVALLKAKDYYLHDGPLHRKNLDKFNYSLADSSLYQDRLVLVIDFEAKDEFSTEIPYKGQMYVKEDDQALLSLEIHTQGQEAYLRKSKSQVDISSNFKVNFLFFEGQYYLNHINYTRSYTENGNSEDWQLELLGESFANQRASFLNYNQRAVLYSDMLNPMINYSPDYWGQFNFSNGIDFQRMANEHPDLEKQFEDHHGFRLTPLPEGINSYEQMANERNAMDFLMQR